MAPTFRVLPIRRKEQHLAPRPGRCEPADYLGIDANDGGIDPWGERGEEVPKAGLGTADLAGIAVEGDPTPRLFVGSQTAGVIDDRSELRGHAAYASAARSLWYSAS